MNSNKTRFICYFTHEELEKAYLINGKYGSFNDPGLAYSFIKILRNSEYISENQLNMLQNMIIDDIKKPFILKIHDLETYIVNQVFTLHLNTMLVDHIHYLYDEDSDISKNYKDAPMVTTKMYLNNLSTKKKRNKNKNNINNTNTNTNKTLVASVIMNNEDYKEVALSDLKQKIDLDGTSFYISYSKSKTNNEYIIISNGESEDLINIQHMKYSQNNSDPHRKNVVIIQIK